MGFTSELSLQTMQRMSKNVANGQYTALLSQFVLQLICNAILEMYIDVIVVVKHMAKA